MSSSTSVNSQAEALLNEFVTLISEDPTANPYDLIAELLRSELYPSLPKSFFIQLYVLSGLLGLALLFAVLTMCIRFWRGASMALFRAISSARGTFICPQTSTTFSLFTGIFLIIVQGHIWETVRIEKDGASQINSILWQGLVWLPLWYAMLMETWGVLITTLMSSHAQNKRSAIRPYFSPLFVNMFFIAIIIGFTIAMVILFVLASNSFNKAFNEFTTFEDLLQEAASTYNGTLNLVQIEEQVPLVYPFLENLDSFINYFKVGYKIWIAASVSVLGIYLPTAFFYIRTLRYQIASLKKSKNLRFIATETKLDGGNGFTVLTVNDGNYNFDPSKPAGQGPKPPGLRVGTKMNQAAREERKRQRRKRSLTAAYSNLMYSCAAILTCGSLYTALAAWIAFDPEYILLNKTGFQLEFLLSVYIYCVLGLLANILTFVRTLDTQVNHKPTSRSDDKDSTSGGSGATSGTTARQKGISAPIKGRTTNPQATIISISAFDPPPMPMPAAMRRNFDIGVDHEFEMGRYRSEAKEDLGWEDSDDTEKLQQHYENESELINRSNSNLNRGGVTFLDSGYSFQREDENPYPPGSSQRWNITSK